MTVTLCERTCESCSTPLERRRTESSSDWKARRFCSRACKSTAQAKNPCGAVKQTRAEGAAERQYVIEEVEFLLGTDSSEGIASRLGFKSLKALQDMLWNEGRSDLATRLTQESIDRPEPCPQCGKPCRPSGMDAHMADTCRARSRWVS